MNYAFKLDATIDERTGYPIAAYLRVRAGTVADTREELPGKVFADYDAAGVLLGVEFLAPCSVDEIDRLAPDEPEPVRNFLRSASPRELVAA